jgi:16S rRNA G966 N2-methylase RsmD
LALIGASARGKVHCAPALAWLQRNQASLTDCDLVFIDPPYGDSGLSPVLSFLATPEVLRETAVVVVETGSREDLDVPAGLALKRRVAHGDSAVHLLQVAA